MKCAWVGVNATLHSSSTCRARAVGASPRGFAGTSSLPGIVHSPCASFGRHLRKRWWCLGAVVVGPVRIAVERLSIMVPVEVFGGLCYCLSSGRKQSMVMFECCCLCLYDFEVVVGAWFALVA